MKASRRMLEHRIANLEAEVARLREQRAESALEWLCRPGSATILRKTNPAAMTRVWTQVMEAQHEGVSQ